MARRNQMAIYKGHRGSNRLGSLTTWAVDQGGFAKHPRLNTVFYGGFDSMMGWQRDRLKPLPFLILTLRRTGGTALTGALSRASPFPSAWHEPLDPSRELGAITTAYKRSALSCDLHAELRMALVGRPNLKHCVETIPAPVTSALIDVCAELGYGMALLTRRDERRRLRSLAIARAAGIWGPRQAQERLPRILAGEIVPTPVELKLVRRDIARDEAALGRTLRVLRHRNLSVEWWIFEEIFGASRSAREIVPELAGRFHLDLRSEMSALDRFETSRTDLTPAEPFIGGLAEADALLARRVTM